MTGRRKPKEQIARELRNDGLTVGQIADKMRISVASVNRYLDPALRQSQSGTRAKKRNVPEGMFDETIHDNWIAGGFKNELNQ